MEHQIVASTSLCTAPREQNPADRLLDRWHLQRDGEPTCGAVAKASCTGSRYAPISAPLGQFRYLKTSEPVSGVDRSKRL
jgi:hypothetical protein